MNIPLTDDKTTRDFYIWLDGRLAQVSEEINSSHSRLRETINDNQKEMVVKFEKIQAETQRLDKSLVEIKVREDVKKENLQYKIIFFSCLYSIGGTCITLVIKHFAGW